VVAKICEDQKRKEGEVSSKRRVFE